MGVHLVFEIIYIPADDESCDGDDQEDPQDDAHDDGGEGEGGQM